MSISDKEQNKILILISKSFYCRLSKYETSTQFLHFKHLSRCCNWDCSFNDFPTESNKICILVFCKRAFSSVLARSILNLTKVLELIYQLQNMCTSSVFKQEISTVHCITRLFVFLYQYVFFKVQVKKM